MLVSFSPFGGRKAYPLTKLAPKFLTFSTTRSQKEREEGCFPSGARLRLEIGRDASLQPKDRARFFTSSLTMLTPIRLDWSTFMLSLEACSKILRNCHQPFIQRIKNLVSEMLISPLLPFFNQDPFIEKHHVRPPIVHTYARNGKKGK